MPEVSDAHATLGISVVIPAHNEEAHIGELLAALTSGAEEDEIQVVVACNACTDRTVEIARAGGPQVWVLDLPDPGKRAAQQAGDAVAHRFPRAYVDADVLIGREDLQALAGPLSDRGVLATAPERRLDTRRSSWLVRSYYRIWERLPQVSTGLFGRGVVVVSKEGAARILALPHLLSDDLAMSEAFSPDERRVVPEATVLIRLPGTIADLVRRRVRVATGNAQADQLGLRRPGSSTTASTVLTIVRQHPQLAPDLVVFLSVTVVARSLARRRVRAGDFTTWLRDESSRRPVAS